jgi:glycosyltransferase involved in cell wall biosynthesis
MVDRIDPHTTSVVIPTACERARAQTIERAIASAHSQAGSRIEVIVVVNGCRADARLLDALKRDRRITVACIDEGNVSAARHFGIVHSRGRYFCFLDDDDELLEGSIGRRAAILDTDADIDFVVTNGLVHCDIDRTLVDPARIESINEDPLAAMLQGNYVANAGAMFRRTIDEHLFDFRLEHFEWTYLLFVLIASGKRMRFDGAVTFRKYENRADSVSKSDRYALAYPAFLAQLRKLADGTHVAGALARRIPEAHNSASELLLNRGRLPAAWLAHLKCLATGGWRFLPYTRHLLIAPTPRNRGSRQST